MRNLLHELTESTKQDLKAIIWILFGLVIAAMPVAFTYFFKIANDIQLAQLFALSALGLACIVLGVRKFFEGIDW